MYVLQAILLILKLVPYYSAQYVFSCGNLNSKWYDNAHFFRWDFSYIDWWIILIPSYFIIAKCMLWWISDKIRDSVAQSKAELLGPAKKRKGGQ